MGYVKDVQVLTKIVDRINGLQPDIVLMTVRFIAYLVKKAQDEL
ncbi:hypothetical protein [Paenibacillus sp. FSL E2-0177]